MAYNSVAIFTSDNLAITFPANVTGTAKVKCIGGGGPIASPVALTGFGGGGYAEATFTPNSATTYEAFAGIQVEGSFGVSGGSTICRADSSGGVMGSDPVENVGDLSYGGGDGGFGSSDEGGGGGGGAAGPNGSGNPGDGTATTTGGAGGTPNAGITTDLTEGIGLVRIYAGAGGAGGNDGQDGHPGLSFGGGGGAGGRNMAPAESAGAVVVILFEVSAGGGGGGGSVLRSSIIQGAR